MNQLHAVSRTQQGRQREPSVKPLRSTLSAEFWRHWMLSGGTQRRALPLSHFLPLRHDWPRYIKMYYFFFFRFLPPGSYLDARSLGPKKLAKLMSEIIGNKSLYYNFFRWRNHYKYKETSSTEDICKLCEMMNNETKMRQVTVWQDFRTWWNGARYKTNCL